MAELGKWMQNSMVEDIRTENSSRVEEGLVLRMRDGTCSQQVRVEYRGQDTRTREETGTISTS